MLYDSLYFVGFSGVWKGSLDLEHIQITQLPDKLKVYGNLHLNNTSITHLPDNLKVGGDLYLSGTPIEEHDFVKPLGVVGVVEFSL